ncbi:hypothetical protein BKA93DRAFT_63554 [Sparassis latifolia]
MTGRAVYDMVTCFSVLGELSYLGCRDSGRSISLMLGRCRRKELTQSRLGVTRNRGALPSPTRLRKSQTPTEFQVSLRPGLFFLVFILLFSISGATCRACCPYSLVASASDVNVLGNATRCAWTKASTIDELRADVLLRPVRLPPRISCTQG